MDRESQAGIKDRLTLLVVEPDDRIYRIFGDVLGSRYHLVFTPNEALAKLIVNDFPFAMVFVGQGATINSTVSLIRTLKIEQPSVPVILIAKQTTADLILAVFRAGARDIVTVPIEADELMYLTDRIAALRLTDSTPGALEQHPPRFNLRNLWSQLRSGSQGYLEIGMQTQREAPRAEDGLVHVAAGQRNAKGMSVFFLGHFRTVINDQILDEWPSRKGKSLFAYLTYHFHKPIFRDVLMDVFWPKSMAESARNSLNVVIHGLRKRLQQLDAGREYILFKNECYCINPEIDIWTDVAELRVLWRKARAVEKAEGLDAAVRFYDQIAAIYKGDFMSDEIYEDWSTLERENLKEIYLVALEKISESRFRAGNFAEAIGICKAILERDNCREEIYRRLMCGYQKTGRRDKGLMVYRKCVHALKTELDVTPSAATIELYQKIRAGASDSSEPLVLDPAPRLAKTR